MFLNTFKKQVYELTFLSLALIAVFSGNPIDQQLKQYHSEYCLSENGDSSKMIEKCLIQDIDRNSDYVLKDGYIWKPNYETPQKIASVLSNSKIHKRKEAMKSELVPWLANLIRKTHFFGDFSQRSVLACFGSWTAFMNELMDQNNQLLIKNKDSIKSLFDLKKYFKDTNNIYFQNYADSNFVPMRLVLPPEDEIYNQNSNPQKDKKSGIVISPQRFSVLDNSSSDPEEILMIAWHKHFYEMFLPGELDHLGHNQLFKDKVLPNFSQMFKPYKKNPLGEMLPIYFLMMLDPADLWSIMANWRTAEDFKKYCDAHGAKPQGWYWRYEAIRSKAKDVDAAFEISKKLSHLHFPPNVSKEFAQNFFVDIVEKVPYNELMITPSGTKVWKRAAEFFGYANKCKEFPTYKKDNGQKILNKDFNFNDNQYGLFYKFLVDFLNKSKQIDPTGFFVQKLTDIFEWIYSKIFSS